MPTFINRYIHVINQEATVLLDNKFERLTPLQIEVIHSLLQHTQELSLALTTLVKTQKSVKIRHELLNLMTPISGYVEMLSDGWMGQLSEQQLDHIKLMVVAAHRLTEYVRKYPVESQEPLASPEPTIMAHPAK